MKYHKLLLVGLIISMGLQMKAKAQTISRDELIFYTSEWKGERFADGRPKIPDSLIGRAKKISIEDAWTVLNNEGYSNQFEGDWKTSDDTTIVVGRAVTAMYMPSRPDVEKNIKDRGAKEGRKGNTNSWPIDALVKGDVYVADGFGKIKGGTLIGDNLGNSIYAKSGNGVVFDGSARDLQGLKEIHGFNAFVRDFDPSYMQQMVLMGLNTPIRIGHAIVLPGDLVIAQKEGVLFVPAHLAEKVVAISEFVALRDDFSHEMLKAGTFSTGEIDSEWGDNIREAFLKWLQQHPEKGKMTRAHLDSMMQKRTW